MRSKAMQSSVAQKHNKRIRAMQNKKHRTKKQSNAKQRKAKFIQQTQQTTQQTTKTELSSHRSNDAV
jgi:hypothetical protein